MRKAVVEEITERKDVPPAHTWDLSKLCPDDAEWDKSFEKFQEMLPEIEKFKGTLGKSAESLRACLQYMKELGIMAECLGYYAHLKVMENVADNTSQA
ncbi:MAG: oligoendopeptidase F, partial [Spirochaetales bacterium]